MSENKKTNKKKTVKKKAVKKKTTKSKKTAKKGKEQSSEKQPKKKQDKEWKNSNIALSITILIIAAIAIGIILYVKYANTLEDNTPVLNSSNYYEWGDYSFYKNGDFWQCDYERKNQTYLLDLYYGPRDLQDLEIVYNKNIFAKLIRPGYKIYIVINPGKTDGYVGVASSSLAKGLKGIYDLTSTAACMQEHPDCEGRDIIPTCDSTLYAAIFIRQSKNTSITYDNNCLTITGEGQELIRAANKVLLSWYGITE